MNGNSWPVDAPIPIKCEGWYFDMQGNDIQFNGETITEDQVIAEFQRQFGRLPYVVCFYDPDGFAWFGPVVKKKT